jgi:hypothetical protein
MKTKLILTSLVILTCIGCANKKMMVELSYGIPRNPRFTDDIRNIVIFPITPEIIMHYNKNGKNADEVKAMINKQLPFSGIAAAQGVEKGTQDISEQAAAQLAQAIGSLTTSQKIPVSVSGLDTLSERERIMALANEGLIQKGPECDEVVQTPNAFLYVRAEVEIEIEGYYKRDAGGEFLDGMNRQNGNYTNYGKPKLVFRRTTTFNISYRLVNIMRSEEILREFKTFSVTDETKFATFGGADTRLTDLPNVNGLIANSISRSANLFTIELFGGVVPFRTPINSWNDLCGKGIDCMRKGQYKEAIEVFKKLEERNNCNDKDLWVAYRGCGLCYENLNQFDLAMAYYKKASSLMIKDKEKDAILEGDRNRLIEAINNKWQVQSENLP